MQNKIQRKLSKLQWQKQYYQRNKKILCELKSNGCAMCGYNKCMCALDFHHTNPKDKKFQIITNQIRRSDEQVRKELNKCILLCKNCHYEIHMEE